MMNQKWIGFGKGTKNKKGEYIEMYFSPDDISTTVSYTHLRAHET